jgi:polar amino acid transport system substrate-binding protein
MNGWQGARTLSDGRVVTLLRSMPVPGASRHVRVAPLSSPRAALLAFLLLAAAPGLSQGPDSQPLPFLNLLWNFAPLFLQGTLVTIELSLLSMALATSFGLCLALSRVYGNRVVSRVALTYIEFMRGTPLLIQLYFIYYGLPQVPVIGVKLGPMLAAVVGVGLNYAAYEAEIYRAGLMAVPRAQTEAALALGLTRRQAIRHVVLPQALRLVIPPVTNDFVALFKDTSIVSILALAELTKTFNIAAQATNRYLEFAVVTALLYFGLAYPLSRIARKLEERIHPHHDFDTQPV